MIGNDDEMSPNSLACKGQKISSLAAFLNTKFINSFTNSFADELSLDPKIWNKNSLISSYVDTLNLFSLERIIVFRILSSTCFSLLLYLLT